MRRAEAIKPPKTRRHVPIEPALVPYAGIRVPPAFRSSARLHDRASILNFTNRWYTDALAHAMEATVKGETFKIISAPYFCATKLEAFSNRGTGDFYHHDLEDIIAVVDGRPELLAEVRSAPTDVHSYLASEVTRLLASPGFMEALPGHLPGDAASQARLPIVKGRLDALKAPRP